MELWFSGRACCFGGGWVGEAAGVLLFGLALGKEVAHRGLSDQEIRLLLQPKQKGTCAFFVIGPCRLEEDTNFPESLDSD